MAAAVSTSVVADLLYSAVSLMMDSLCRLNQQRGLKKARKNKVKIARQMAKRIMIEDADADCLHTVLQVD